MRRCYKLLLSAAAITLCAAPARAQFYPGGFGPWGWDAWGHMGGSTVGGDIARGLGSFMAGAGVYEQQNAIATSINADTIMRWNQYIYMSQMEANRVNAVRDAARTKKSKKAYEDLQKRIRENPEKSDIESGSALNAIVEDLSDPRIYLSGLKAAKASAPGEVVRNIPFQYARGGITTSFDNLTKGGPPKALLGAEFTAEVTAIKAAGAKLREEMKDGGEPSEASIAALVKAIEAARSKAQTTLPKGSPQTTEADRFLKALLGLADMMRTPHFDILLAGVEKRPEVSLDQVITFMKLFSLRFGKATSVKQRAAYSDLYPKLVALRDEARLALPKAPEIKLNGHEAEDFFSSMTFDDLEKKAEKK